MPAREYHTQQVHYLRKAFVFGDGGSTLTVGKLPAGAIVVGAGVIVAEAFNAGTTNTLDIGTSGDGNGFGSALSLTTVGNIVWDDFATSDDLYSTADSTITATVNLAGTAATAGAGYIYVQYIPDNDG